MAREELEGYHALLAPSSAYRWMCCPGSVHAQAAVTDGDSGSPASREGTVAHALLEVCMLFGFEPQSLLDHALLGQDMPSVAQHMVDGVQHALDWVEEYIDFYGAKNLVVDSEQRVRIGSMIGVDDDVCNGTPDITIRHLDNHCLVVIDYKHGMMAVEAEDNEQLLLYTLGGIKEHGKFKEYKNVIVQPRAAKRRVVDETTYKNAKVTQFIHDASRAATAALAPDAPRVAGSWCRFCKAASNCQTYRRRARQVAADEFDALPDPESIANDDLNEILQEASILEQWIASIKARALAYVVAGGKLDDFELRFGARRRIFQNEAQVIEWCKRNKLGIDSFMPRALLSPHQLEDVLKKAGMYPRGKRGEGKPDSPIAFMVGYTIPAQKLYPRKSATSDFDAIGDE